MKNLEKILLCCIAAVALAAILLHITGSAKTSYIPEPDKTLAVTAPLGAEGCIVEYWQFPYKYKTINGYLKHFPDARPGTTITTLCTIKGLPTDIPATETFESYNYANYDYPVVIN